MLTLTLLSETTKSILLGWTPVPGCLGYVFYADGKRVANTWDPSASSVRFAKGPAEFRVVAVGKTDEGVYPPPVSAGKNVAYMKWGDGSLPSVSPSLFEVLFLSQGGITGGVPYSTPACFYTSPQVTVQGTGWDYAIGYDQALANGWMLRSASTNALLTVGTGQYFLDPANQGARVAFADAVLSRINTWGADGVFHDDIQGYWGGLQGAIASSTTKSTVDGTTYTQASWQAAVAGWCQYVGGRIKAAGKLMAFNATKYVATGNGVAENNGDQVKELWTAIGGSCCTHLCNEFFCFTPQGARRLSGTSAWYNNWEGWQSLVAHAHSLGTGFLAVHDTGASSDCVYSRASALLDYSTGDLWAKGATPDYDVAWAKNMGKHLGAKYRVGNEWRRDFAGGTVTVDPVAGTAFIPSDV